MKFYLLLGLFFAGFCGLSLSANHTEKKSMEIISIIGIIIYILSMLSLCVWVIFNINK